MSFRPPVILFVDDEEGIRDVLGLYGETLGYEFELACDGEEALKKIESRRFDIVFTDVQMPKMNGIDLLYKARKSRGVEAPQFVFVTAGVSNDTNRQKRLEEALPFVSSVVHKPFDQDAVSNAVIKAMSKS